MEWNGFKMGLAHIITWAINMWYGVFGSNTFNHTLRYIFMQNGELVFLFLLLEEASYYMSIWRFFTLIGDLHHSKNMRFNLNLFNKD